MTPKSQIEISSCAISLCSPADRMSSCAPNAFSSNAIAFATLSSWMWGNGEAPATFADTAHKDLDDQPLHGLDWARCAAACAERADS